MDQFETQTNNTSKYIITGVTLVIVVLAVYFLMPRVIDEVNEELFFDKDENSALMVNDSSSENGIVNSTTASTSTATTSSSAAPVSATTSKPVTMFKDGTYTSTGSYASPSGKEQVEITLTVKDDKIFGAKFVGMAENPGSKRYQGMFAEGFESAVVGKSLNTVTLSQVNGSSLTPKGFNDAIAKIKLSAK